MCCYFSWRSHQRCGHGQELQRSQSTYLWRRSQQISLVTRQVHCYNFTPSPAVTAPRSLICRHSKKTAWTVFTEHFDLLSSVGEDVLDADTIASAEKFACRMCKTSEDLFDLACVVLLGNISNIIAHHRPATLSSNTLRDDTTKPRCGARRAFRNRCFRTQRRQTGR